MSTRDDAFEQRLRAALDAETDALDGLTVARLRAARMRALDRAGRRRARRERWVPAMAATAAIVIAFGFTLQRTGTESAPPAAEAFELLAAGADLELVEELEFYEWLISREHAG